MIERDTSADDSNNPLHSEIDLYYTLIDAGSLINDIGLNSFLYNLFRDKTKRVLTIEELEAMQLLHDRWEM